MSGVREVEKVVLVKVIAQAGHGKTTVAQALKQILENASVKVTLDDDDDICPPLATRLRAMADGNFQVRIETIRVKPMQTKNGPCSCQIFETCEKCREKTNAD